MHFRKWNPIKTYDRRIIIIYARKFVKNLYSEDICIPKTRDMYSKNHNQRKFVFRKILIGIQKNLDRYSENFIGIQKICAVFRKILNLYSEKFSVNRKIFLPLFRKIKLVIRKIMDIFRFCRIQILLNTVSQHIF